MLLIILLLASSLLGVVLDSKNKIKQLENRLEDLEKRMKYEFKEITLEELPLFEFLIVVIKDVDGEKVVFEGSTEMNNKLSVEGRGEGVVEVYKKHDNESKLIREVHF